MSVREAATATSSAAPLAHWHADRLLPPEPGTRAIARRLYEEVRHLPIISPHGHTDPRWFADNEPFANPSDLLITPDHYLYRMLYSQGVALEAIGLAPRTGPSATQAFESDPRRVWQRFADHFHLFRGTPSWIWFNHVLVEVFGFTQPFGSRTADACYDVIDSALRRPEFLPRALFERFGIEVLATTESPLDDLAHHRKLAESGWKGRVITAWRPDPVVDPEYEGFGDNLRQLATLTGRDTQGYDGYLQALRDRRRYFAAFGATSTDHGHPTARTANLGREEAEALFRRVTSAPASAQEAELFRAQMLVEMAQMSVEDGLVMQLHPGSSRNHNPEVFARFGRDKGADIPMRTDYVQALRPLLDRFGNDPAFSLIVFTLDESTYARELAPLAGHYPALKLGPAWWFHDSPEGMRRFREQTTETAGFYNTVGFNDDTRAFLSIPARHDVARRCDCAFLARLVAEHRMTEADAVETAIDLAYRLVKKAYKL
jgi:glucuronate isomerase